MRCLSQILRSLALGGALTACNDSAGPDTAGLGASRVVISPDADTINALGDTATFTATVTDANGFVTPGAVVTWRPTAPAVVAVSDGKVVSVTAGTVGVIATAGAVADTVQVLSRQIAATLDLAHPPPALAIGESFPVPVSAADSNGAAIPSSELEWISAAPSVMNVSDAGVMRGESVGSTTITVASSGRSIHVAVRVIQPLASIRERIAVGSNHSCALNVAGEAYCWGSFTAAPIPNDSFPERVTGDYVFSTITAGGFSACALTPDGTAYCWGSNWNAQLGDGTRQFRSGPVRVLGTPPLVSITVGYGHACGLTQGGAAYCWGRHPGVRFDPNDITGARADSTAQPVAPGMVFRSISVGWITCGVTTTNVAYCWGENSNGELGDGTNVRRTGPTTPVAGNLRFIDVRAGERHACGLTTSGHAYCWGFNEAGQLGDGTQTTSPVPVAVVGGHTFTSLAAGAHTCAVTAAGTGYCWGYNWKGQLGNGSTGPDACTGFGPVCARTPQRVTGGLALERIAASRYAHSCGEARDGATYCWGSNDAGQIGNGEVTAFKGTPELTPVRVYLP